MDWTADITIPDGERIKNKVTPENDDDAKEFNARWEMRIFDKLVDGQYRVRLPRYNGLDNFPATPEEAEIGYDLQSKKPYFWDGSGWQPLGGF